MDTNECGLLKKDQVFVAGEGNGEDCTQLYGKHTKEVDYNLKPNQKCYKTSTGFSSGDDCSTTYELKMESTIVEQNNVIMTLEEELEIKNRDLTELHEELTRKNILIQQMEETIMTQNDSIENLQYELKNMSQNVDDIHGQLITKQKHIEELEETVLTKNKTMGTLENELKNKSKLILEMKDELQNKEAVIEETERLRVQISDLTNEVKGLEEVLRVKNETIQRSNQWHIEMKDEFDTQSALALEREGNLKLEHNREIEKLKEEFLEQFNLVGEKQSLLEMFLENQIALLFNRLGGLSEKCFGNKKDIESFQRIYNEELKKVKLNVVQFPGNVQTDNFIKKLEELNKNLAVCFLHEESIKVELKSKMEELERVRDELNQSKKMCDRVSSNEKQLFTKLTQTEIELNQLKEEKAQLQQRLAEANANYEKVTIEFNRDRQDIEKKYRQALDSYETELIILNKSLQELLCNIPTNFESGLTFLGSGDSSLVSLNSDVNSMISNPNIFNAQKIVTKCLYELGKLRSEMKSINQESKAMRLALDAKHKALEEKNEQLKKLTDEFELIKSKYSEIDNEKKYLESKLRYMVEENNHLNTNIQSLSSEVSDLNDAVKKYQEEVLSLKKMDGELKKNGEECRMSNVMALSPILQDKNRLGGGSDTELVFRDELQTPDVSFQSLPGALPKVYTSTPFHAGPLDLEGGGELTRATTVKLHSDFQVSLLKWMERCQQLDKENKVLLVKVQDLELLIQDLNLSMRVVKEEMDLFQEKQKKLEKKLNMFVSLEKQLVAVCNETDLKDQQIKTLTKEINSLAGENTQLFNKNLELEEMYRKHVSKLTEIKHVQNIPAFTDSVTNTFNEKVKEIIRLKGEINALNDNNKALSHRMEMLIESNNSYVAKLNDLIEKLSLSQEELEKTSNEKLEVFCSNKLLKKEIELLQQRVDYLTSLRDNHWCNPSSMQLFEDMHKEVLQLFRSSLEYKLDSNLSHSPANKDLPKANEKLNPLKLPELLQMLSTQLRDEKADFEQKATEFQQAVHSIQDRNTLSDDWLVRIDKMLRNILEEMKYHKEQYYRIEEALRNTGKFHDELQKQKDELRVKEHEIAGVQKKLEEEKMKSKKSEAHLKMIEQDVEEKNELIKSLVEQRDRMEKDILELQKEVFDTELTYQTNLKTVEWNKKLEELKKSKQEIEDKISLLEKGENEDERKDCLGKGLKEAEQLYHKAIEEVKAFLHAEMSSNISIIQEEHKEQVEQLQRVISEQAIRIGFLLKKTALNTKVSEESDSEVLFINEDLRKQFELAVYALQQLHHEELQLLRLQLEAEKYNGIYEALQGKNEKVSLLTDTYCNEARDWEIKNLSHVEKTLVKQLEYTLRQDFTSKLRKFFSFWHSLYKNGVSEIEDNLSKNIENYIELLKVGKEENAGYLEEHMKKITGQHTTIIENTKDFLRNLQDEQNAVNICLNNVLKIYTDITMECLEKIKESHSEMNDCLQLNSELTSLKKEKEELEKRHKNAIELLHADHKAEEDKIQLILTEIKKCCESGCDPNTLLKIKEDLEEKHKKELEDLRAYYVQMCANMEKQYSEDVNSLHSRMLSLSSSCSDDIISEQVLFDKSASQDHIGNIMLSEVLPDNFTLENFSTEQMKVIEELNYKWSEDVKEMKRELENKYTKKIEELQERLSTFIYNNELDISVRCIKDEVMRDCKHEMENIEKEISSRMLPFHDDIESLKSENDCFSLGREVWRDENDLAWEQLVVDLIGNFASNDALNRVTKEFALTALKNVSDIQQQNFMKLFQFLKLVDNTLSGIENKMKEKENQLLSLQNKLNCFSQTVLRLANNWKLSAEESKARNNVFNNSLQLEKMLEEGYSKDLWPPELAKVYKVFQNKLDKMLMSEKEKHKDEIVKIKQALSKEKEEFEKSFESDLNSRPSIDEFDRLIRERDSLKQMTLTLKSAVSQLVSYLNTCEDELNKTVVDELLKICEETPKKGCDFSIVESSPKRVHFAPEVGLSDLDETEDLSTVLRLQLDSCLSKLKLEAASLLGITSLQPPPANLNKQIENLRKENEELLQELSELKLRLEKSQNDSLELRDQLFSDPCKENGSTFLQDKAQYLLNNAVSIPSEAVKLLEDLAKFGDKLINELQKERIDLEQQIEAADKQLKSTRQFLEEQAVERESERDEYAKEVTNLQNQLKERGKNWTSHERFTSEVLVTALQKKGKISLSVEELELQLKEANGLLEESEKKRELLDVELKDAIDKVWVLRDIISDLESQLNTKSEKEALLEKKLDELEVELDQQNGTQYAMAQELESLRSQSMDDGYLEQIKQLQENIKVQFNSSVVRQMKLQIRDMEKALDHRTKELEAFYLTNSNNSLSSPSEEVSLREQLEWKRCKTPEDCPSPVALPTEELGRLQDKLMRHSRAEEVLIKRLRDSQLVSAKLSTELEEVHADREILQLQLKKQMAQLAESNNKIDDLRHKVETAQTSANKDLVSQFQELKEKYSLAEQTVDSLQNQLVEYKGQLSHAEEIISKQQIEIRNLAHCDHEIVDSLRLELAAVTAERNKLEELLDKSKRDFNLDVMNALLVDKNEDIDQLQQTVALLQNQDGDDKHGSCNSKGYRVSFATDIEESSDLSEGMRLRDAPVSNSLDIMTEDIQVFGRSISPICCDKDENEEYSPPRKFSLSASIVSSSTNDSQESNELLLNSLKMELSEKCDHISSLEKEVRCLKTIEVDLQKTKSELESVLSSVSEDKQFYEGQLQSLQEKISQKDEEIQNLKKVLFSKDEEIIKTTADVQALREISLNLQSKLKEATDLAEKESNSIFKEEVARLKLEMMKKEEEIRALNNELLACKNDLSDEKELSKTLRSSLNIVTQERLQLEQQFDSLKTEHSNLKNALQAAEDNFEQYVIAVRNLKNDLLSQSANHDSFESNVDSSLSNTNFEESEVLKLKQEIMKLLKSNEQLKTERNKFLEEAEELKYTITANDFARKDLIINKLQDELKDLRKIVLATKEEKLEVFSNFSSEINQLQEDANRLQESKQEAIEKWKNEHSEKQKLLEMYERLKKELSFEKQKKENEKVKLVSRREKLSFCDVNVLDIPPVSYVPGLDALAEKMRKEIKLSATLDNSLLETILPDNNESLDSENKLRANKITVSSDHEVCTSKIRSLERALIEEIEKSREGKRVQREKENQCTDLETEKYQLKLHIDRLGRLVSNQNDKINQLLGQVESQKEKIISLELSVLKEQSTLKQVSKSLEEERSKAREVQRDDITLIETMRKRLQNLMEKEITSKKVIFEERQKSEGLLAQLNSVLAIEKYRSDSDDDNHKHVQKVILNEREKYLALRVEYEKEKRSCEDLREVLARERTALCLQRDQLSKFERLKNQIEKENSVLKQKLNEEHLRRQVAESKILEVKERSDSKFQKELQALEERNKKSLDAAHGVIRELEHEYNELKEYLRNQQEHDDNWKENVHAPLLQQLNEVNDNLDGLVKERLELQKTVHRLNEENSRLQNLISELRMMASVESSSRAQIQLPHIQLRAFEAVTPFMEREVDDLLHRVLHAEHHRKALVFQKRYLLGAVRGYQEAHTETRLHLLRHYHLRRRPSTRISFRVVALAVVASFKLMKLPLKRLIHYNKKKEMLLRSLQTSISRSTAEAERLAAEPMMRQPAPHSPPSRDRAIQRYR